MNPDRDSFEALASILMPMRARKFDLYKRAITAARAAVARVILVEAEREIGVRPSGVVGEGADSTPQAVRRGRRGSRLSRDHKHRNRPVSRASSQSAGAGGGVASDDDADS
jgi:hypothetical protein